EKATMTVEYGKLTLAACLILLTTMCTFDSLALDGVIPSLQKYYAINDSRTALIKTISASATTFTLSLMWIFGD
ncbi:hypothetical protein PFISCL1PPCAC_26208, partial [Pristionchus fissidentatus]